MLPSIPNRAWTSALALQILAVSQPSVADGIPASNTTKRGISWIGTSHSSSDNRLFFRGDTPLTWYKSWSAWPASESYASALEFVPMIHSLENLDEDIRTIQGQPARGDDKHVLTFNEPDGATSGGGTNIDAKDAAEAWEKIAALRDDGYKISMPATTGSEGGWEWLQRWNESCWDMYEETGCEFDFVNAHWYGAFEGLTAWLGRLHEAWPDYGVWVTEMALPEPADRDEVLAMMNASLPWLDQTEWVDRYAWFGAFREEDANDWTGDVVALLNDDGGLTDLGSMYMGGEATGFEEGERDQEAGAVGVRAGWSVLVIALCVSFGILL